MSLKHIGTWDEREADSRMVAALTRLALARAVVEAARILIAERRAQNLVITTTADSYMNAFGYLDSALLAHDAALRPGARTEAAE